jgi:Xaa-Pro aminopeptidase
MTLKNIPAQILIVSLLLVLGVRAASAVEALAITAAEYAQRRAALRARIGNGLVALHGNVEAEGPSAFRAFHQESSFYYLTGFDKPGAMLLIGPADGETGSGSANLTETLYIPPRDRDAEVWTGPQLDPSDPEVARRLGFQAVRSSKQFEDDLKRLAKRAGKIYSKQAEHFASEQEKAAANRLIERIGKATGKRGIGSIDAELTPLRQVKSPAEQALLRAAVDCTMQAHREAGRVLKPGLREYQIAALMKYVMEREGCTITGFDPIVGAGLHTTILHYLRGEAAVAEGDLVVMDVGGEYRGYSADVTRTLPASGKFTPRQREIYEIVLGAQEAVLKAVRPGVKMYGLVGSLHNIANGYLDSHGKDLQGRSLGRYFRHGIGHQVGLDVHDVEDRGTPLKEGMVIAIEPGLYLPEEKIGVRIEDNVLVTKDGGVLLSGDLPRTVDEIEKWMAER